MDKEITITGASTSNNIITVVTALWKRNNKKNKVNVNHDNARLTLIQRIHAQVLDKVSPHIVSGNFDFCWSGGKKPHVSFSLDDTHFPKTFPLLEIVDIKKIPLFPNAPSGFIRKLEKPLVAEFLTGSSQSWKGFPV